MKSLKRKWLITGGFALSLTGLGISIIGDAIMMRVNHAEFFLWFLQGLLGLVLFNSGISLFGQAVIYKIDINHQTKKETNSNFES